MPTERRRVNCVGVSVPVIVSDSDEIAARSGSEGSDVAAQSSVFAGMTVLSRLSGLARDTALAHFVGATGAADTFYLAFRIPNFFRRLFAESTFALAFVPVLSEYRERGSQAALRAFVEAVSGNFIIVLLVVTLVGVAGAGLLAALFMPGFLGDAERFALATDLTRIMFPYMALISLTAFAGAILNSVNRFAVPAFTPVLLNLALIVAAFWAATGATAGVSGIAYALAWGVLAGGAAQLLFNLPSVAGTGLLVAPRPNRRHEGVAKVLKLLVPAVFAGSAYQVNALIGTVLASLLEEGSPSWLYYADRLWEVPIGIVAIALGTVLLPNLSRLHTVGDSERFNDTLDWGVRTGLLLGIPAAVALWVLAYPLVATIFLHGEMRPYDADRSAGGPARLLHRSRAARSRQGGGARVLLAPGLEDAAQVRPRRDGGEHRDQPGDILVARTCWPGIGNQHCRDRQCRIVARRAHRRSALPAGPPTGSDRTRRDARHGGDGGGTGAGTARRCSLDRGGSLAADRLARPGRRRRIGRLRRRGSRRRCTATRSSAPGVGATLTPTTARRRRC